MVDCFVTKQIQTLKSLHLRVCPDSRVGLKQTSYTLSYDLLLLLQSIFHILTTQIIWSVTNSQNLITLESPDLHMFVSWFSPNQTFRFCYWTNQWNLGRQDCLLVYIPVGGKDTTLTISQAFPDGELVFPFCYCVFCLEYVQWKQNLVFTQSNFLLHMWPTLRFYGPEGCETSICAVCAVH